MFCPINEFTKAMELFEDRVGGGSPEEGPFAEVVVSEILVDLVHQFAHALERTAPDGLLGDQCEPALDLVEPACVGQGVVVAVEAIRALRPLAPYLWQPISVLPDRIDCQCGTRQPSKAVVSCAVHTCAASTVCLYSMIALVTVTQPVEPSGSWIDNATVFVVIDDRSRGNASILKLNLLHVPVGLGSLRSRASMLTFAAFSPSNLKNPGAIRVKFGTLTFAGVEKVPQAPCWTAKLKPPVIGLSLAWQCPE